MQVLSVTKPLHGPANQWPHSSQARPQAGGGDHPEKWWYLPELYKLTKVLEDHRDNEKKQFSIEIFVFNF